MPNADDLVMVRWCGATVTATLPDGTPMRLQAGDTIQMRYEEACGRGEQVQIVQPDAQQAQPQPDSAPAEAEPQTQEA